MHFDLSDQERASFLQPSTYTVIDGPQLLVRFTDSTRGHTSALGTPDARSGLMRGYWMYASDLESVLCATAGPGPYGRKLIKAISDTWAICDDWSNLERVWVLVVPPDGQVSGYCGRAKFQPRVSEETQNKTGRVTRNFYNGEGFQLVLGLTKQQARWVHGPLPTLSLSGKKLAEFTRRASARPRKPV